jgi:hypothetical protein
LTSLISFYQTLTNELMNKIGFEGSQYVFSYSNDDDIYHLEKDSVNGQESRDNHLYLQDPQNIWDVEQHNLILNRKGTINNSLFLFGQNGLASEDSVLGIALSWFSKSSNQRGIVPVAEITHSLYEPTEFVFQHIFNPGQIKGKITLELIIYLKHKGSKQFSNLASNEGTVLGVLDSYVLVIDGNGSMFPILEVRDPLQPLWWVNCDWSDPLTDSFSEENISIVLNAGHKSSKLLNSENGLGSSPLLIEIISSAIQIIIHKAKESGVWDSIETGSGVEPGSIGQAIYYFIQTFGWDISSPERLARSIREDLERRI